jgi:hypothetical protein
MHLDLAAGGGGSRPVYGYSIIVLFFYVAPVIPNPWASHLGVKKCRVQFRMEMKNSRAKPYNLQHSTVPVVTAVLYKLQSAYVL